MKSVQDTSARLRASACPRCLRASHLTLSWEDIAVCEDISFDVARGELVCLVGRSGSGKTTLFHAIAGLTTPDSGSVWLGDENITGRPGRVSYMLQKDLLLPQHTIIENASIPLVVNGASRKKAHEEVRRRLSDFGLEGAGDMYPAQLSGGMRQRAALLRTCLMHNDVILMDEPFSALDAFTRAEMRQWFLDMLTRLDMSCMLITHDVDEAVAMADRVLVLAGNPSSGMSSRIVGEICVLCDRAERSEFALSEEALELKREILNLIG